MRQQRNVLVCACLRQPRALCEGDAPKRGGGNHEFLRIRINLKFAPSLVISRTCDDTKAIVSPPPSSSSPHTGRRWWVTRRNDFGAVRRDGDGRTHENNPARLFDPRKVEATAHGWAAEIKKWGTTRPAPTPISCLAMRWDCFKFFNLQLDNALFFRFFWHCHSRPPPWARKGTEGGSANPFSAVSTRGIATTKAAREGTSRHHHKSSATHHPTGRRIAHPSGRAMWRTLSLAVVPRERDSSIHARKAAAAANDPNGQPRTSEASSMVR
jgi:hypothetical protein